MVLELLGQADACTAPELQRALGEAIDSGRARILVELDGLNFMSASTLGVLVEGRQRVANAGGTLQVRCRSGLVRRMLSATGLDDMLDVSA